MPRLPIPPDLEWREDGTPVARGHDDVYFSASDGLAEARAVFLAGCGLPERWTGQERFTIAETGFGTGLNFLAAWDAWRAFGAEGWLEFVSFEAHPMRAEDAMRALSAWPELEALSGLLLARWPHSAKGVRRLVWPEHRIGLTLHIGDVRETLPDAVFAADAWFLDGFSPAKNEAMWGDWIYPEIAKRSAAGAQVGTFTVAGHVRRGLASAGFAVAKAPGFGKKRERLEATLETAAPAVADRYAVGPAARRARKVAIIGGGIAGAGAARALIQGGAEVTVFERAPELASGASGNAMALVMPRLDAGDTVQARLLIDAYVLARDAYWGLNGVTETSVWQMPRDDRERDRFAKVLADPPLPLEDLEALSSGGCLHKRAFIVRPPLLVPALFSGARIRRGIDAVYDLPSCEVNGEPFDAIVLASGMALNTAAPWLSLEPRLGQVEYADGLSPRAPSAQAAGHYALADGSARLWGATFEAHEGDEAVVSAAARAANAEALRGLSPAWMGEALGADVTSRAGVRATTPDRLPLIGALPDVAAATQVFDGVRTGRKVEADAPRVEGVYVAGGFGARGFTWAPWAGEILAAQILGGPAPAPVSALEAISPMRLILRRLKRGEALPGSSPPTQP